MKKIVVLLLVIFAIFCINSCKSKSTEPSLYTGKYNVGDVVKFYGKNHIVLAVEPGMALLISQDIYKVSYDFVHDHPKWIESDLRKYMDTIETYRTSDVLRTKIENKCNQWFHFSYGSDPTIDRVFLLSIEEVVKYFGDSGQMKNKPPGQPRYIDDQYNKKRRATYNGKPEMWHTRSPGENQKRYAVVDDAGRIFMVGYELMQKPVSIRPAVWVKN